MDKLTIEPTLIIEIRSFGIIQISDCSTEIILPLWIFYLWEKLT